MRSAASRLADWILLSDRGSSGFYVRTALLAVPSVVTFLLLGEPA